MLLRSELKDSDIPHRTTIRNHVKDVWDSHMAGLETELQVNYLINYFTHYFQQLSAECFGTNLRDNRYVV